MKRIALFCMIFSFNQLATAQTLEAQLIKLENEVSGKIGVSILDTETNKPWSYRGDERFPLMSTFKTLACAKMLFDIDNGKLSAESTSIIEKEKIIKWSPITENMAGQAITIKDACQATMLTSDNTAANIILEKIGGPAGLTSFLRQTGDPITRLDRYEPDLGEAAIGDNRDTTTPNSIVKTLEGLVLSATLKKESRHQLKQWMIDNKVSDALLRSVLPGQWLIADRSGAGRNGSRGITAIVWPEKRSPLVVSIYITQTDLELDELNHVIARIGKLIFEKIQQ